MTPPKGYYIFLPLNAEARRVADTWDPAKDETAGNQCKGYGAGEIMRLPTRVHITWQDDNTLKLETDTGQQTRIFHFGTAAKPTGEPTWQGYSVAEWQYPEPGAAGRANGHTEGNNNEPEKAGIYTEETVCPTAQTAFRRNTSMQSRITRMRSDHLNSILPIHVLSQFFIRSPQF